MYSMFGVVFIVVVVAADQSERSDGQLDGQQAQVNRRHGHSLRAAQSGHEEAGLCFGRWWAAATPPPSASAGIASRSEPDAGIDVGSNTHIDARRDNDTDVDNLADARRKTSSQSGEEDSAHTTAPASSPSIWSRVPIWRPNDIHVGLIPERSADFATNDGSYRHECLSNATSATGLDHRYGKLLAPLLIV